MKAHLLCGLILLFPAVAHAEAPVIAGEYTVEGKAKGGSYRGQAAIAANGDVFLVIWQIGQTRYQGTGLLHGNTFAVTYASQGRPALALYDIQADGSLTGTWTEFGSQESFTETLTPKGRM
jgi:hypothetical protein